MDDNEKQAKKDDINKRLGEIGHQLSAISGEIIALEGVPAARIDMRVINIGGAARVHISADIPSSESLLHEVIGGIVEALAQQGATGPVEPAKPAAEQVDDVLSKLRQKPG